MTKCQTNYKQTEIGEIPEEWKVVKLSDIARIEMGQSPKSEYYNGNCEGLPFLQGIKTFGDRHPYFDTWCTKPAKIAESGDILLSVRAPVGVVNISNNRLCIGRGISAIRGKNTNFIYYLLRANSDKIDSRGTGTVYRSINKSDIQNLVFAIPPELEQQQIASILSSLDDKIELNKKMNKTLEEIGKAFFKRWFVDFEFPNDEGKPYKSSGGEMVDSEIGEIPEGWNIQPLSAFIEFIKGKKPKKTSEKQEVGYLKQILIETFDTGKFIYAEPQDTTTCTNDDVLMVMDGASSGRVEYGYSGIIGSTLAKISVKEPLCPEFLYFFLKTKERDIRENTTGTSIPHTDKRKIEKYCLSYPSIYMIREFSNIASRLLSKILLNNNEIMNISQVRDSLLPRLMSGKLRVKN